MNGENAEMSPKEQSESRTVPGVLFLTLLVLIAVLAFLVVLILQSYSELQELLITAEQLQTIDLEGLELEQLRQEVLKLQLENTRGSSFWEILPSYATLLTAIVAIGGVLVTIWRQMSENKRQRDEDSRQRERDRQQREIESKRMLDEKFNSIIENLGGENQSIRVSAAVSIMTFLKPEYKDYYEQVYLILLANLKIEQPPEVNRLLIEGFEEAIQRKVEAGYEDEESGLDLTNTHLYRVNLNGLNLQYVDIAFADMRLARLINTNLYRVRGYKVNLENARCKNANFEEARMKGSNCNHTYFHEARLISARFEETSLVEAEFYQAQLQSAHFQDANLTGARFEKANLDDVYFNGAILDEVALRSIKKALNWQKAHFDEEVKAKLF